jgi:predicted phage terminase large subunit-like protein
VDPLGRSIGDALWPEYYSREILLDLKETLPQIDWQALYKGKPTLAEGKIVKAVWFRRHGDRPRNEVDAVGTLIRREVKRIVLSVDTATKKGVSNNYTVITVWIEGTDGIHYLVDVRREKVEFTELITLINETAREWRANTILVEDAGNGTSYLQSHAKKAPCPVIAIPAPRGENNNKMLRFEAITPFFEAGLVSLPRNAPWVLDYMEELLEFPGGTYDDQVDSTSQYLSWIEKKLPVGGSKKLAGAVNAQHSKRVDKTPA